MSRPISRYNSSPADRRRPPHRDNLPRLASPPAPRDNQTTVRPPGRARAGRPRRAERLVGGSAAGAAVGVAEEEPLERAEKSLCYRTVFVLWFESSAAPRFVQLTELSMRPSVSFRLSSRSSHSVQKPLSWSRTERSISQGFWPILGPAQKQILKHRRRTERSRFVVPAVRRDHVCLNFAGHWLKGNGCILLAHSATATEPGSPVF